MSGGVGGRGRGRVSGGVVGGVGTSELFQLIISCCCSFAVVILDSNYYQMVLKPNTHTHTHAYKEKPVRFFQ